MNALTVTDTSSRASVVNAHDADLQVIEHLAAQPLTMSSIDLLDLINHERAACNEPEVRRNQFNARVEDELEGLHYKKTVVPNGNGTESIVFELTQDQCMLVAMRESKAVRRTVLEKLKAMSASQAQPRAMTAAEMFLQNAQAMVEVERRQMAQATELKRLSASMDTLMVGSMTLTERPANSESITHIRTRMQQKYGLPARIVDLVMRQMPYSPKPAGMVKNQREEAQGASYAVYWVKDVSTTFARFVKDCTRVTTTKAVHPDVEERFALAPGVEVRHG